MVEPSPIDTSFHFETDAGGRDPDTFSPTLRRYHQLLWSKPLPDGSPFTLEPDVRQIYLHHQSRKGDFFLASDAIVHSYRAAYVNRIGPLVAQVPRTDVDELYDRGSTIGGYVLFPGEKRNGQNTINQARGLDPRICDRFDLTLECIRRHYVGEDSPLSDAISRYGDFFELFADFHTYVAYWLLEDLVDEAGQVRWHLPFDDFQRSPLPTSLDEYEAYRQACLTFLELRNERIAAWAAANL